MSLSKLSNPDIIGEGPRSTTAVVAARSWSDWRAVARDLVVLFKLRVVSLLLLAAVGGAFIGAGGWPGATTLILLLITGGMAASGASALNQFLERGSDGNMGRTRLRPLVTGTLRPGVVLLLGISLILLPSLAILPFNPALTFFLILGAIIYVGIYTIWLKPRTLLNIVIGGAAGSAAVMSGGAAAGAWQDPAVIVLALVVFLWTPAHFWSLALLYRDEYRRVDVPMLPAQTTEREAALWVSLHTAATALAAILLAFDVTLGLLYLLPVGLVTLHLFQRNLQLIKQPSAATARSFFMASNVYLMVVLAAICMTTVLTSVWPALAF